MRLLFTGASGFLGKILYPLLSEKYEVYTMGLSESNDIKVDLSKDVPDFMSPYDIVLHACGKAHFVPRTEEEKKSFYDVNYQGTINLCSGLKKVGVPKSLVFISTVAVYGCESGNMITENHPLDGCSPYAKSKILAENFLKVWCQENGVILSIFRPSLIAGVNAPGNLGAMVRGIKTGRYLSIGNGKARKSVLMAQDIANLLPLVINKGGIYNVCDSHNPSFKELENLIAGQLNKEPPISIPLWIARIMALCGDMLGKYAPINSAKLGKITNSLTFSNERAVNELGWKPLDVLENYHI